MNCDGSITVLWSLNVFINGFPSPCRRLKNQTCQDIKLQHAVHKLSVSIFI